MFVGQYASTSPNPTVIVLQLVSRVTALSIDFGIQHEAEPYAVSL